MADSRYTAESDGDANQCPRCGGPSYLILFRASDRLYETKARTFHVVECSACRLIRLRPTPTADEVRSFYRDSYWWETDSSASGRLAELYRQFVLGDHVRFVTSHGKHSAPVLDVGCGGGAFVRALIDRGIPAVGLDVSPIAAGMARVEGYSTAVCGALPFSPFAARSFSAVTLLHVLEHVPDPAALLLAIDDLLIPGGKLIVQVPNAASWQFLLLGERWSGLDMPRHLTHFRAADLESLLAGCGFTVRRRKFFSLRDNPASLATSLCPSLEPVVRRVRGIKESSPVRLLKDALYASLVAAALPLTLVEAASGAGATVMLEAMRTGEA